MALSRRSDGRLLDTLPWTLAALALTIAPHALALPSWIVLLALVCGVWRWLVELRRGPMPWRGLRIALAMGGFLSVLFSYGGINGVGPGTALLVIMASLKLLETRSRRDQFVLLFIALFLVLAAFLRGQHIWALPYLFASLFVVTMAWLNVARQGTALTGLMTARSVGRLMAHALPLMLIFWLLFPRVPGPFWAIPKESGVAVTGLSDRMSPGDITRLGESGATAFRVWFESEPPARERRYWRAVVMDRVLSGRTWAMSERRYTINAERGVAPAGEPVRYRITMEPTRQPYLFALETPKDWTASSTYMTPQYELMRTQVVDELLTYSAISYPEARTGQQMSNLQRAYYTRLPPGTNPRAQELAQEIREQSADDESFVRAALDFYRQGAFRYTLAPPSLGQNATDEFLFDTRRGFCEHFATSFATLMRAGGIPARTVAGYQGGERNRYAEFFTIRQSDAHAWTEIWFDSRGWVRVDPTAIVAPERIESGLYEALAGSEIGAADRILRLDFVETLRMYWDVANARWNEWVLGFGPETQRSFLRWLGLEDPDWETMVTLLVILLTAVLGVLSVWLAWQYKRPRPDRAMRLYQRFVNRTGLPRPGGEAPLGFADRAARRLPQHAAEIRRITTLYLDTRYAGKPGLDELEAAVTKFARRPLPGPGHLRGTAR